MNKRWIGLLPCVSLGFALVVSCSSTDSGGPSSNGGVGGASGGVGGSLGGASGAMENNAGAAGEVANEGGAAGNAGAAGSAGVVGSGAEGGSAGADDGGAGGSAGAPVDTSPLSPSAIPDLALWLDGNAQSFSDRDENFPTPPDSGRVRSVPEAPPLKGSWQAPTPVQRPIRELGAFNLRPVESSTGYYLQDTAGTIQTDNSTLAISFRTLNTNSAQGALTARIGTSSQNVGIFFLGDSIGVYYNHTQVGLKKHVARGLHTTIIVRFTPTGLDVQYQVEGHRSSESVATTIDHETASNFLLGYDTNLNASIYGFVSQVVGVDRAISDEETGRLMTWMHAQPVPDAFPVTKPLVAIVGDSIANGDQVSGWQSWGFRMLANLAQTNPDVQLLNDASNGAGVPTVKNSTYSDNVLPWYSANRAKNILIVAAGTNDLANGSNTSDVLDRYYGLLNAARATGWKTVACTILPRSSPMNAGLAGYETARKAFNADVVAHYAMYADALADVASVAGMGAAGDSDNLTNYSDKIHPTAAGHALIEPVYRAAVAGLL